MSQNKNLQLTDNIVNHQQLSRFDKNPINTKTTTTTTITAIPVTQDSSASTIQSVHPGYGGVVLPIVAQQPIVNGQQMLMQYAPYQPSVPVSNFHSTQSHGMVATRFY
jgi:hypothetical protein